MTKEKYGFVYVWYDRKHKRYYVGRHWGYKNDGYICSSKWMRKSYKRRPHDFKRRIIKYVYTTQLDLVTEEQYYLNMIKQEECGKRYYNKTLKADAPSMFGRTHSDETKLKMSRAAKGKIVSDVTKEKLRQINLGKKHTEEHKQKIRDNHNRNYSDPNFLAKMSAAAKNRSIETRQKISDNNKRLILESKIGMTGRKHSEKTKLKMSISAKNRKQNINTSNNLKEYIN